MPTDRRSCCRLDRAASEFECQGLELDLPIVCWGDDLVWKGAWKSAGKRSGAQDPHRLRLNAYRVLLSRGRDGMILYVPESEMMDSTYEVLVASGAKRLPK
jgi:DUF2075 family protein